MAKLSKKKLSNSVWKGPEVDGVTQTLLKGFLGCKERFRLKAIEGWKTYEKFSPPLEYGQMWHVCEEELAAGRDWQEGLKNYANRILADYPDNREDVTKWYKVCKKQFPHYIKYWSKHKDTKTRKRLLEEYSFCVPYKLPSGRVVKLRGKFDSVDIIGKRVWLQENKTKGRIDENGLSQQLTFDLQTMMYLLCLKQYLKEEGIKLRVEGVRYNVVRRPLSGGRGTIKPRKATKNKPAETMDEYYDRLEQYFVDEPEYWFIRWNVAVTNSDLDLFKNTFLNPCLEHLCRWYDHVSTNNEDSYLNYRTPYGVNTEIRGGEIEEYLTTGSTAGLRKVTTLFPELEEEDANSKETK